MLIACKCLNTVINCVENESPKPFSASNKLKIGTEACVSDFFREALGPLADIRISHEIDSLLQTMSVGLSWSLSRCLNCNTITHATNVTDKSFLVNSTLLTNQEEINKLKTLDHYSHIYKILLNLDDTYWKNNRNVIAETPKIRKLSQMRQEYMQDQTEAANERIMKFKEQEFENIKAVRERADQEFMMLMNKIREAENTATIHAISFDESEVIDNKLASLMADDSLSLDTPPETPEKLISSESCNEPPLLIKGQDQKAAFVNNNNNKNSFTLKSSNNKSSAIQQVHSSTKIQSFHMKSSNDDVLFELEGMGIEEFSPMSNDTLSDEGDLEDDDSIIDPLEDSVFMAKRATFHRQSSIAKSLPIVMPAAAMAQFRGFDDDIGEAEEAIDIAASIQALAISVRGDSVFGDLPRPRLNTQF